MTTFTIEQQRVGWIARAGDFVELTKPRISIMVLVTVTIAMLAAGAAAEDLPVAVATLLGVALVAASASACNQWLERDRDGRMLRTADRPLPAGRLTPWEVLAFALLTMICGMSFLMVFAGWSPAAWALATWIVYVCVYTPLKSRTMWNTAVGAVSGALPVLIGWSAIAPVWDLRIASLFLVLFFWQFPHFVAIAWIYRQQYSDAGFRMMTVTDPSGQLAAWHAMVGALILIVVAMLPAIGQPQAWPCLLAALLASVQLFFAWRFSRQLTLGTARQLLAMSIVYLPLALGLLAFQAVP
jgi:protoheme IX farnesyltransferase